MIQAVYTEGENRIDVNLVPNEKKGYDLIEVLYHEGDLEALLEGLKKRGIEGTEPFKLN